LIICKIKLSDSELEQVKNYISNSINAVNNYLTKEDRAGKIGNFSRRDLAKAQALFLSINNISRPFIEKKETIIHNAIEKYIKKFGVKNNKEQILKDILQDIEEILENFEKFDFLDIEHTLIKYDKNFNDTKSRLINDFELLEIVDFIFSNYSYNPIEKSWTNNPFKKSYSGMCYCLTLLLAPQILALFYYGIDTDKAAELIEEKAALFYKKPQGAKPYKIEPFYDYFESRQQLNEKDKTLLDAPFMTIYNGNMLNSIMKVSKNKMKTDRTGKKAIMTTPEGVKMAIQNYDAILSGMGSSSKKLYDTLVAYLSDINFYGGKAVNLNVEVPFIKYGEKCGYFKEGEQPTRQKIKDFAKLVRKDLKYLENVNFSYEETKGKNAGSYAEIWLLSGHKVDICGDVITAEFGATAANYLVNSYVGYVPTVLLKTDNRHPNAYPIGRKIAFHNSNDNNAIKGTQNTLSVRKLLEAAPDILSMEELTKRDKPQRNWKDKIKRPLENALNENVQVGYIKKWEYRAANTGKTYTPTSANKLSWAAYSSLIVHFVLYEEPDKTGRLQRKAEQKEARREAAAAADKKKRNKGTQKKL
jgi:hypothetical protein